MADPVLGTGGPTIDKVAMFPALIISAQYALYLSSRLELCDALSYFARELLTNKS